MANSIQKAAQIIKDKNLSAELVPLPKAPDRNSLLWWMAKYFHEYATGTPRTLKFKAQDLKHFYEWYASFKGHDRIGDWSRATTNAYLDWLRKEKTAQSQGNKKAGDRRWANRSINRKLDHLKGFSKWIRAQVPSPIPSNPMENIKRLDVPALEAKRISPEDLEALTTAALHLVGTECRLDQKRFKHGEAPLRKTSRPFRDYAIFALLKGSGLRISEVCNLDLKQLKLKRLEKVITKGAQERTVVISQEAYQALKQYIESEREDDAKEWENPPALFLTIPQTGKLHKGADGRMSPATAWNVIKKIARRALGKDGARRIHPHLFRHHVGYVMNERGGITAVQKQLGHKNIAYSAVYSQRTEEELEGYLDGGGL